MKKIKKVIVILLALLVGATIATIIDARKVYTYDAIIVDKTIMFSEDGIQKFCIEAKFDDNNHLSRREWICKKWAQDVNWGFSYVGDDIIYKEVKWEWWWKR